MFYFRICHLISATLHAYENKMMPKVGRFYRSYEHILSNDTHNCDGQVNLVLHTAFQTCNHEGTHEALTVSTLKEC